MRTKIGDVFEVQLDGTRKKYFQYVANDLSQLNSDVIRVFREAYQLGATPNLSDVVNREVEFHAHRVIKWGIKMGLWKKVGSVADVGNVDALFRNTNDYGSRPGEQIEISSNWYVWRIDEEFKRVGTLPGDDGNAEIGIVVSPPDIVHRMRTGRYSFVYPGYK